MAPALVRPHIAFTLIARVNFELSHTHNMRCCEEVGYEVESAERPEPRAWNARATRAGRATCVPRAGRGTSRARVWFVWVLRFGTIVACPCAQFGGARPVVCVEGVMGSVSPKKAVRR